MKSIRSSLLTALFLSIIFQGAITLYKFFVDSRLGLVQFYDSELVEFSQVLPAMAAIDGIVDSDVACEDKSRVRLVYATWNNESASPTHLSCRGLAIKRPSVAGLSDQVIAGENWRIYTRILSNGVSVVAQPSRVRAKALTLLTSRLATQLTLLIPLFLILLWFVVNRSLKPIDQFANELRTRSPSALQIVSIENLPKELIPVANALNDLLHRLQESLAVQKNFIADAAHEILTPLTALQVQLQVLERAKTEDRRSQAAQDVKVSLERCINLARQLLSLARSSSEVREANYSAVNLVSLAHNAIAEALTKAHAKKIDLGVLASTPVSITGDELSLQVLLRNLVDNAIKYSNSGGRVDVQITSTPQPQLTVSDDGPGVPIEEHSRLFDRFYRGANPDIEGTGLGLAIVKEIAEQHHAKIELRSPGALGGLDVIVRFPKFENHE